MIVVSLITLLQVLFDLETAYEHREATAEQREHIFGEIELLLLLLAEHFAADFTLKYWCL